MRQRSTLIIKAFTKPTWSHFGWSTKEQILEPVRSLQILYLLVRAFMIIHMNSETLVHGHALQ